jgi:hypothetical protein
MPASQRLKVSGAAVRSFIRVSASLHAASEVNGVDRRWKCMDHQPRFAKAHSELVAAEYQRLGWTLVTEFREALSPGPYEYLLEWKREGPPNYINWEEWRHRTNS